MADGLFNFLPQGVDPDTAQGLFANLPPPDDPSQDPSQQVAQAATDPGVAQDAIQGPAAAPPPAPMGPGAAPAAAPAAAPEKKSFLQRMLGPTAGGVTLGDKLSMVGAIAQGHPELAAQMRTALQQRSMDQKQRLLESQFYHAGYQPDPTTGKMTWNTGRAMAAMANNPDFDPATAVKMAQAFSPQLKQGGGKASYLIDPLTNEITPGPTAPETPEEQAERQSREDQRAATVAEIKARTAAIPATTAARTMTAQAAQTRAQKYQPGGGRGARPNLTPSVQAAFQAALIRKGYRLKALGQQPGQ